MKLGHIRSRIPLLLICIFALNITPYILPKSLTRSSLRARQHSQSTSSSTATAPLTESQSFPRCAGPFASSLFSRRSSLPVVHFLSRRFCLVLLILHQSQSTRWFPSSQAMTIQVKEERTAVMGVRGATVSKEIMPPVFIPS